jgi:hypothetical protein
MSFSVDTRGLVSYGKTLRDAARRINWATAFYLTELASKMRLAQRQAIEASMHVRRKKWLESHIVIESAKGRTPAAAQIARAGSRLGPRFTGWLEQVDGGTKNRLTMSKGREGGTRTGLMSGRAKLRPGNKFLTPKSIRPRGMKGTAHRTFVFLLMMARARKQPFILDSGHPSLQAGVWTLEGKHGPRAGRWPMGEGEQGTRLRQLQEFGADKRIKQNDWNDAARVVLLRRANTAALWKRMWEKAEVLPKKKKCK